MEDKRAEPRNRPPELQTNGLWDMPTLVNNVETLAWAPAVILLGEASGVREHPGSAPSVPTQSYREAEASRSPIEHQTCRAIEKAGPETDRSGYGSQGRPLGGLATKILRA